MVPDRSPSGREGLKNVWHYLPTFRCPLASAAFLPPLPVLSLTPSTSPRPAFTLPQRRHRCRRGSRPGWRAQRWPCLTSTSTTLRSAAARSAVSSHRSPAHSPRQIAAPRSPCCGRVAHFRCSVSSLPKPPTAQNKPSLANDLEIRRLAVGNAKFAKLFFDNRIVPSLGGGTYP